MNFVLLLTLQGVLDPIIIFDALYYEIKAILYVHV